MSAHTMVFTFEAVTRYSEVDNPLAKAVADYTGWPLAQAHDHVVDRAEVSLEQTGTTERARGRGKQTLRVYRAVATVVV